MPARIGQIHHRTASQRIEVARQAGHPALSNQIQTLLHPPPPVTINHHPIPHRILSHTPHRCQPTPTIHSYHCRIHSLAPPRHVSIDNTTVQLFTPQSHLPNDRARPLFTTPGKPIKHNLRPPPLPRRASSSFGRAFPPQRVRERESTASQPPHHTTTTTAAPTSTLNSTYPPPPPQPYRSLRIHTHPAPISPSPPPSASSINPPTRARCVWHRHYPHGTNSASASRPRPQPSRS